MSGLSNLGRPCKTCTRSAGPSLAAQPAALTSCVNRTALFLPSFIEFDSNSIVTIFQSSWLDSPQLAALTKFAIRRPSFPHALSGNPGESGTGFPINTLGDDRSEEHTSELQSRGHLVCRLLLEKKKKKKKYPFIIKKKKKKTKTKK